MLLSSITVNVAKIWNENRGGREGSSATKNTEMKSVEAIDFPTLASPPLADCSVVEGLSKL